MVGFELNFGVSSSVLPFLFLLPFFFPASYLRCVLLLQEEVRSLAAKFDLPNKDRKDSQGICFLGKVFLTLEFQIQLLPISQVSPCYEVHSVHFYVSCSIYVFLLCFALSMKEIPEVC